MYLNCPILRALKNILLILQIFEFVFVFADNVPQVDSALNLIQFLIFLFNQLLN